MCSKPESGNTNSLSGESKGKLINPAKHWCFTLNNYTESDISSICSNINIKRYVFQEETGKNGTAHLQGYIEFTHKLRPKKLFPEKIHWEITRDITASVDYCQKEESRTGKIYKKGFPEPIKLISEDKFYIWEKEIIEIINGEVNDRIIYWYYDKKGGCGKSSFSKYLCVKHSALYICGKSSDLKYGIIKSIETTGLPPKIVIMDIPRNMTDISFSGIEEVKNGIFFNTKYESQMCIFNSPHMIIFSNELPDITKLSADRWVIKNIGN